MPDVEVKLNIEAEYKQALQSIAVMGKALEGVQEKAKVMIDATKNVQGGNNTDPASLEALNKASKELSENMAKVAAAGKKAQDALKAISELKPQSEESIQLLEKAAAGYEKLAEMAKNAADAAERFNKVGSAGLTTEEMLRQAQAVEKHLAALKQQSEALERSIASQKEQLNLLRQKNAEEAKAAQFNQQKERQEQLNIALLDKQAKAEEEAHFKMQLANKTRLELVNIIKEITAKYKEASAAQDVEAMQKYERQLTLANQALRKVNMNARVANIALMQQAQAAQRIGQNLTTLVDGFNNLGEAAKNGELNLVSLGSSIVSLTRDIKAGLGPIGWVMLALQGLQVVWNNYAKTKKRIAEVEAENQKILENEKNLYNELKTAREEYDAQVALATSLSDLNTEYDGIKTKLKDSLRLIEESTRAELVRLNLVKSQEEFEQIRKRYELGRAYKRGDITEEQYRRELINLEQEQKTAEARRKAAEAEAKLEADTKSAEQKSATAKEALEKWGASALTLKGFKVTESDIQPYEEAINKQNDIAKEQEKKIKEILEKAGLSKETVDYVLKNGLTKDFYRNLGTFDISIDDLSVVANMLQTRANALESGKKLTGELTTLLGGRTATQYRNQKKLAEQEEEFWRGQKDETNASARKAWQDVMNQPTKNAIENQTKNTIANINAITAEKIKDLENDIVISQQNKQRQDALTAAKRTAQSVSSEFITKELERLVPGLSSSNAREKAYSEQMSAIYQAELNRRQEVLTQGKAHILSDGVVGDKKDAVYIAKGLKQAEESGSKAEKEMFKALYDYAKKKIKDEKDRKAFSEQVKKELGR